MLIRHPLSLQRVHPFSLLSIRFRSAPRLLSAHRATLLYFIVMRRGRFYCDRECERSRFRRASDFIAARAIFCLLTRSKEPREKEHSRPQNRNGERLPRMIQQPDSRWENGGKSRKRMPDVKREPRSPLFGPSETRCKMRSLLAHCLGSDRGAIRTGDNESSLTRNVIPRLSRILKRRDTCRARFASE